MAKLLKRILVVSSVVVCGAALYACGGTGGGEDSGSGTVYTPGDVGTLTLDVNDETMSVADTTGFSVIATNANGDPVPNTKISCDSEAGIGIIEPNTGAEITDSDGHISGRVGCELPGSYLFGCRLAVGAAKRKFVTIKCSGSIPAGFTGFEGAAGGGLGTGGAPNNGGGGGTDGNNTDGVRVTAVGFNDSGGASYNDTAIDRVAITDCDGDTTTVDPEPFFDTLIQMKVRNDTNSEISFTGYTYSIVGQNISSRKLAFLDTNLVTVSPKDSINLQSLFAHALGATKYFADTDATAIGNYGFTNVKITLFGENDQGDQIQTSFTTVISFGSYNRC